MPGSLPLDLRELLAPADIGARMVPSANLTTRAPRNLTAPP